MRLPAETSVRIHNKEGRQYVVPGRVHRGLAMVTPYDLRTEPITLVPQRRDRPCWAVVHVSTGMTVGSIWGRVRAAWAELCRLAEAADWERPGPEVIRDEACCRLHTELRRAAADEMARGPVRARKEAP
jgi:hypothetical protein